MAGLAGQQFGSPNPPGMAMGLNSTTTSPEDTQAAQEFGLTPVQRGLRAGWANNAATYRAALGQLRETMGDKEGAQADFDAANAHAAEAARIGPKVNKLEDINDTGSAAEWLGGQVGGGLAAAAPMVAGGALGRGWKSNSLASRIGTHVGVGVPIGVQQAGSTALDLHNNPTAQANTTPEERGALSLARGTTDAVAGGMAPSLAANRIIGGGLRQATRMPIWEQAVKRGVEGAKIGAAGMGEMELSGEAVKSYADPNRDRSQDTSNLLNAAATGAVFGVPGAASGAAEALHNNAGLKPKALPDNGREAVNSLMSTQHVPADVLAGPDEGVSAWLDAQDQGKQKTAMDLAGSIVSDDKAHPDLQAAAKAYIDGKDPSAWQAMAGLAQQHIQKEDYLRGVDQFAADTAGDSQGEAKANSELTGDDKIIAEHLMPLLPKFARDPDTAAKVYSPLKDFMLKTFGGDSSVAVKAPSHMFDVFGDNTEAAITTAYNDMVRSGQIKADPATLTELQAKLVGAETARKRDVEVVKDNLALRHGSPPDDQLHQIATGTREAVEKAKTPAAKDLLDKAMAHVYGPNAETVKRHILSTPSEEFGRSIEDLTNEHAEEGSGGHSLDNKITYTGSSKTQDTFFKHDVPGTENAPAVKAAYDKARSENPDAQTIGPMQYMHETGKTPMDVLKLVDPKLWKTINESGSPPDTTALHNFLKSSKAVILRHEEVGAGPEHVDITAADLDKLATKEAGFRPAPKKVSREEFMKGQAAGDKAYYQNRGAYMKRADINHVGEGRFTITRAKLEDKVNEHGEPIPTRVEGNKQTIRAQDLIDLMREKKGRGAFDAEHEGNDQHEMLAAGMASLAHSEHVMPAREATAEEAKNGTKDKSLYRPDSGPDKGKLMRGLMELRRAGDKEPHNVKFGELPDDLVVRGSKDQKTTYKDIRPVDLTRSDDGHNPTDQTNRDQAEIDRVRARDEKRGYTKEPSFFEWRQNAEPSELKAKYRELREQLAVVDGFYRKTKNGKALKMPKDVQEIVQKLGYPSRGETPRDIEPVRKAQSRIVDRIDQLEREAKFRAEDPDQTKRAGFTRADGKEIAGWMEREKDVQAENKGVKEDSLMNPYTGEKQTFGVPRDATTEALGMQNTKGRKGIKTTDNEHAVMTRERAIAEEGETSEQEIDKNVAAHNREPRKFQEETGELLHPRNEQLTKDRTPLPEGTRVKTYEAEVHGSKSSAPNPSGEYFIGGKKVEVPGLAHPETTAGDMGVKPESVQKATDLHARINKLYKDVGPDLTPELAKRLQDVAQLTDNSFRDEDFKGAERRVAALEKEFGKEEPKANLERVGHITRERVRSEPDSMFLFGDNDQRRGFGGQAAAMRGEPNAVGVRTKAAPHNGEDAFWSDKNLAENMRKIDEDLAPAFAHEGKVVIPRDGLGTGRAQLRERAPRTLDYLNMKLDELAQKPNAERPARKGNIDATTQEAIRKQVEKMLGPGVKLAFEKNLPGGASGTFEKIGGIQESIRIALSAFDPMAKAHHEAMHALFARLQESHPRIAEVLKNAAGSQVVLKRLEHLLKDEPKALKQLSDPEERLAYAFQFWSTGRLKLGPDTTGVFSKIMGFIKGVLGHLQENEQAQKIFEAFRDGDMADKTGMDNVLNSMEAKSLRNEYINKKLSPAMKLWWKGWGTASGQMERTENPFIETLRKMFYTKEGEHDRGENPDMLQEKQMMAARFRNRYGDAIEGLTQAERNGDLVTALQTGQKINNSRLETARVAIRKLLDDMHKYMGGAGMNIGKIKNYFHRVWDTDKIVADPTGFTDDLFTHHEDVLQKIADKENLTRVKNKEAVMTAQDVADAITNKLLSSHGVPPITEHEGQLGYTPFMAALNERKLDWIDPVKFEKWMSKDLTNNMTAYIVQGVKRAEYARRFGDDGSKIRAMFDEAQTYEEDKRLAQVVPGYKQKYAQAMEDSKGDRAKALTSMNIPQLDAIKQESQQHLMPAAKAVMAMEGTLGNDISPLARRVSAAAIVYQNVRILGYQMFSSFTDPGGAIVQTGDVKGAYKMFTRGLEDVARTYAGHKKDAEGNIIKDQAERDAEQLGTVDMGSFLDAMNEAYNSVFMYGKMKAISNTFFRLNGMEAWNRAMRIGATQVAINFLKRQAEAPNEHTTRRLEDLSLKPEDIQIKDGRLQMFEHDGLSPEQSRKMQLAVTRMVDSIVMRPNAAQRTVWGSDPHFAVFFHMKQFTYTFTKTILARVAIEAKHGNMDPLITLAAVYMPIQFASDVAKDMIKNGGTEPDWKKNWGPADWFAAEAQRAGLAGPAQFGIDAYRFGPQALLGPTADQVGGIFSQSPETSLTNAVPAPLSGWLLNAEKPSRAARGGGEDNEPHASE